MNKNSLIFVAGHTGLVGSALLRELDNQGYRNIVVRSHRELDLIEPAAVNRFMQDIHPEYLFICAGRVGGVQANNTYRADFIRDNLLIATNLIDAAHCHKANKTIVLGSSCIYPRLALQPMKEEYILTGALEPTNEPYAVAKIAGIVLAQSYRAQHGLNAIAAVPTNVYGPNDNFDLADSHVIPALLRNFHTAKTQGYQDVTMWGSGKPVREFMFVDDLADALIFLMQKYDQPGPINVGTGVSTTVAELAGLIAEVVGFQGNILHDTTKPDGMPKKLLDSSRMSSMGWRPKTSLHHGLKLTYEWALSNNVL